MSAAPESVAAAQAALNHARAEQAVRAERLSVLRRRRDAAIDQQLAQDAEIAAALGAALTADPDAELQVTTDRDASLQLRALATAIDLEESKLANADSLVRRAEQKLADAKAAHVFNAFEGPSLEAGMATLGQAYAELQRALAARVAAGRYGARTGGPSVHGLADFYGPIGRLLHALATFDWPEGMRPDWAPKHPGLDYFWPHDRREVCDMAAQIAAELDQ